MTKTFVSFFCACALLLGATFPVEIRTSYTTSNGLPANDAFSVATVAGGVYAGTAGGLARFSDGKWVAVAGAEGSPVAAVAARAGDLVFASNGAIRQLSGGKISTIAPIPPGVTVRGLAAAKTVLVATDAGLLESAGTKLVPDAALNKMLGPDTQLRQVAAGPNGEVAAAAAGGLFLRKAGAGWQRIFPTGGNRSWSGLDARGVAFDSNGRLWYADPQGAGCYDGSWKLYTGLEGLPYDDFTTLAAGENGVVWMGTKIGAIRYDGKNWEYRQGLRWLPGDDVRAIAVTPEGHAWFATAQGVGVIERRPMTFAEKAKFFEDEIDRYHRRTPYQYVMAVSLKRPGDKSEWTQHDSDNDGLWTAMYGAGECFAYAATKDPLAKKRARQAFEALRFLSTVTQGGEHPAPPGFPARAILPVSGRDPNIGDSKARDEQTRARRDHLWKVMSPRWPKNGEWYWKSDTSSDETDGHYFLYALYYDLVAETPEEKEDVRKVVVAITDHMLNHNYCLVDWDGLPTRWAIFNPENLNDNAEWWNGRGLNSLSILSYLKVAEHMTGDAKYRQAYDHLVRDHKYAMNLMFPKSQSGPGSGNQSDDEMAFMSFYNLIRYETDPKLQGMYAYSFADYWNLEKLELNPFFNYVYAGANTGKRFASPFTDEDLSPTGNWEEESLDTLRRFPLDRVGWRMKNSHRKDIVPLRSLLHDDGREPGKGWLRTGRVLPVDERFFEFWNHDPYDLNTGGDGRSLADGAAYLLPYYMGLYYKFVE